ncbi:MAG: hypothetical protein R3C18_17575 [Planctomycetaceae bacterium]
MEFLSLVCVLMRMVRGLALAPNPVVRPHEVVDVLLCKSTGSVQYESVGEYPCSITATGDGSVEAVGGLTDDAAFAGNDLTEFAGGVIGLDHLTHGIKDS